ncbi:unnamed protein product [Ectocarpus sp. CCAP 1310/34]|nr:unnamed protein product [Ectocarpus sp. CCAP 1310/34]
MYPLRPWSIRAVEASETQQLSPPIGHEGCPRQDAGHRQGHRRVNAWSRCGQ